MAGQAVKPAALASSRQGEDGKADRSGFQKAWDWRGRPPCLPYGRPHMARPTVGCDLAKLPVQAANARLSVWAAIARMTA